MSHRGLSGSVRRTNHTTAPSAGPISRAIRQPRLTPTRDGSSRKMPMNAAIAAPPQYVPFTRMSARPRFFDGMSSSMAELIAAYSPPMPMPAMNRHTSIQIRFIENAATPLATR